MGCNTSTSTVGVFDDVTMSIVQELNHLGLTKIEIFALHKYFNKLCLTSQGELNTEMFLKKSKVSNSVIVPKVFLSVGGELKNLTFAEFVMHSWRFLTMERDEMAIFAFDTYVMASNMSLYSLTGNCSLHAENFARVLCGLNNTAFGDALRDVIQDMKFSAARDPQCSVKFPEHSPRETAESLPAEWSRDWSSWKLTRAEFCRRAHCLPSLLAPIYSLQDLLKHVIIGNAFWDQLQDRARSARQSQDYLTVFENHRRLRQQRTGTSSEHQHQHQKPLAPFPPLKPLNLAAVYLLRSSKSHKVTPDWRPQEVQEFTSLGDLTSHIGDVSCKETCSDDTDMTVTTNGASCSSNKTTPRELYSHAGEHTGDSCPATQCSDTSDTNLLCIRQPREHHYAIDNGPEADPTSICIRYKPAISRASQRKLRLSLTMESFSSTTPRINPHTVACR